MELLDYERKHIEYLEENSHESVLFLKRNNEFPIEKPCDVVLVGCGARNTIKGGTGSGDVASRFFVNFEKGLEDRGFKVTSKEWMDKYDEFRKSTFNRYVKDTKKRARKAHIIAGVYSMGFFEEEKEYDFLPEYEGNICIYVLSRNSGEGNDRRNIKGDVLLSDREVSDINYLNRKFKKFMLVLNVGGVVDLSPVKEISNILYVSQLGVVTGSILPKILLGEVNPSGKLATTWAKPEDYPFFNEFGDLNDTYYKEGIYVGYRYFDSAKKEVLYPFGFGLSYSEFKLSNFTSSASNTKISLSVTVTNTSNVAGKEVVQSYVSVPSGKLDQPYQVLSAFRKSGYIEPGSSETLEMSFDLKDIASYDTESASYILESGRYIVRAGNSSRNTKPVCMLNIKDNIVVSKLQNKCGSPSFKDLSIRIESETLNGIPCHEIDASGIIAECIEYKKDEYVDEALKDFTDGELALLTCGHHESGFAAIVGSSCKHVVGGAGETTCKIDRIKESLTMADGPAGLRLKQAYGIDEKGIYDIVMDPLMEKMMYFLPKISRPFLMPPKNRNGEVHYQYTTAIPIGTALAQSFNLDYVENIGKIIREEMGMFNVDLWLAPALNIHRNILCGRNFEYYSEDPLVSGKMASAMTKGVEADSKYGVTLKHFACNNQEFNRNNNNSHVSERALREIYLKGFEICIKETNPKAIMTSYNLINGTHTSESYELLNDILRCEFGFDGLIMTDWIASGRSFCPISKYPAPYASNNILAGNDLTMSGCPQDIKDIEKALNSGKLKHEDLLHSASRIYRSISRQKSI